MNAKRVLRERELSLNTDKHLFSFSSENAPNTDLNRSWISSRLLPLVSGTNRRQNMKMAARHPPNIQKAPASGIKMFR